MTRPYENRLQDAMCIFFMIFFLLKSIIEQRYKNFDNIFYQFYVFKKSV